MNTQALDLGSVPICATPTVKYPQGRTGTYAGVQAHRGRAEGNCDACREANRLRSAGLNHSRKAYRREHYEANRLEYVARNLKFKHAMTLDEYDELLAAQGGGCAVCGSTDPKGRGRFHVDHDHRCCPGQKSCGKCVRGLLCCKCNPGLGSFNDDPELLIAAAAYLMTKQAEVK